MFSFAAPLAFALAFIALPIIGFYLLKVRLRRIPVSTNLFWKQIYEEKPPRSLWQQLRHWISLAVQLAILALLVTAIADPFFPWQKQQAQRLCFIIDNSASMGAKQNGISRLEDAKRRAMERLDGIRELDEVAIVLVNDAPQVLVGMTSHLPTLKNAVQGIQLASRRTTLQPAIELGKRLVGEHPHGEIVLYSDGMSRESDEHKEQTDAPSGSQIASLKNSPATEMPNSIAPVRGSAPAPTQAKEQTEPIVRWELVGKPQNNLGITQFQVRRSLVDAIGYEVLVEVLNASDEAVEARLELHLNGATMDVLPLRLNAGEKWTKSLEKTSLEGGEVSAELTKIQSATGPSSVNSRAELNSLEVDDRSVAILPARRSQNVLIVTPGNLFLKRAFEANPLVNVIVEKEPPTTWPTDHLIVLHQTVPSDLPPGNVFIIDPTSESKHWKIDGEIEDPIVTEQAEDSPLMRHIRMDNVVVPKAKKLSFEAQPRVLAGTVSHEVIYAELLAPESRCLLLNVPLEESDLAFRTAFPILVTNALHWFSRQENEFSPAFGTGAIESIQIPKQDIPAGTILQLIAPSGAVSPVNIQVTDPSVPDDSLHASLGPLSECGVWKIAAVTDKSAELAIEGATVSNDENNSVEPLVLKSLAVNLSDSRESDLRGEGELTATASKTSLASGAWFTRPLWFYIALLGCLACLLEWVLYQRRIIT